MHTHESSELNVQCAACAGTAYAGARPQRHYARHNRETYTLLRCTACELQFWWPLKADPSVYAGEGFEAYKDYHAGSRPFPRWAEPLFSALPESTGAALDIGCGDGAVLSRLASMGFEPNGIDLDERSIQVARDKFGLDNAMAATLEDYAIACQARGLRFSLITFFEVLEHQDDPRRFLAEVKALGLSGATVAGSVPNRQRFLARLDRRLSDGDLPPHHFLWFSRSALTRLLENAGFTEVSITCTGALPYAQIVSKIGSVIMRKTASWPRASRLMVPLLKAIAIPAAVVPWLGMRLAPSHLFFRCRVP